MAAATFARVSVPFSESIQICGWNVTQLDDQLKFITSHVLPPNDCLLLKFVWADLATKEQQLDGLNKRHVLVLERRATRIKSESNPTATASALFSRYLDIIRNVHFLASIANLRQRGSIHRLDMLAVHSVHECRTLVLIMNGCSRKTKLAGDELNNGTVS